MKRRTFLTFLGGGLVVAAALVLGAFRWLTPSAKIHSVKRYDVIAAQGHYTAYRLLAADERTHFYATEIAQLGDDRYEGSLWATIGCHSGHNLVDAEATAWSHKRSFAETLLSHGGSLVGGTGYQYGDSVLLKNSEQLYVHLFDELRYTQDLSSKTYPDGVMTVGRALVNAKSRYVGDLLTVRGIDEKAIGVATLYGLPMMPVHAVTAVREAAIAKIDFAPTAAKGLTATTLTRSYGFVSKTTDTGEMYFVVNGAEDSTTARPLRPVLPAVVQDLTTAGGIVTDAIWMGGSYEEQPGTLAVARPVTERVPKAPKYRNEAFLPAVPFRINQFLPGQQRFVVTPMQFNALTGTIRRWKSTEIKVLRRDPSNATPHDAPLLTEPRVERKSGGVEASITVRHYASADEPIEAYASFIPASEKEGTLRSTRLRGPELGRPDGRSFVRTLSAVIAEAGTSDVRVFFQVAGANGRVARLTNGGRLYPIERPAGAKTATILRLDSPSEAAHRDRVRVRAALTERLTGRPIARARVLLRLASSRIWKETNGEGVAEAELIANVLPRDEPYLVVASFVEDDTHSSSAASAPLRVRRARVRIVPGRIVPGRIDIATNGSDFVATVLHEARSATGVPSPLGERPVEILLGDAPKGIAITNPASEVLFAPAEFGLAGGTLTRVVVRLRPNARYEEGVAEISIQVR